MLLAADVLWFWFSTSSALHTQGRLDSNEECFLGKECIDFVRPSHTA